MKAPVVVVGSYVQDLAFYTERFPRPGETVVGDFRPGPGGKGFNQAVAAARAGIGTLFIGAVGPDGAAGRAKLFAREAGLHVHLAEKPKHATGAAAITVNGAGQNHIIISLGANLGLKPRDVPLPLLASAQVVLCQAESDYATVTHVLRTARRNGAMTVFNPAPMRPEFDPAVLRHVEVVIPNESEFTALVKRCPPCAALLRSAPYNAGGEFTEATLQRLAAISAAQAELPRPALLGRVIGLPAKKAPSQP